MLPALFALGGALAILVVRVVPYQASAVPWALTWQYLILGFLACGLVISVALKRSSRVVWEALLTVAAFLGVWYVILLLGVPVGWSIGIASLLTLAHLFLRVVALHDLFFLLGCVGVTLNFALWLPSEVLLVALAVFTIYDMIAGPPGGPIVALAETLVRHGFVPGFILPARLKGLWSDVDTAVRSRAAMLGTGDLILPLMLVARAAVWGTVEAAFVLAGLLLGAVVLSHRKDLHPRAALVPLAVGAVVPFLAVYLTIAL
jgi:presenilin-like A22 family membrane protease